MTAEAREGGEARSVSASLPGPRAWPLVGNLMQLETERLHQILEEWAERYGDVFAYHLGPSRVVAIGRGDLVREVLRQRPDRFRRWSRFAPIIAELGGDGVLNAEGADWKRQRRMVMPAFGRQAIERLLPSIALVTSRLERLWDTSAGAPIDVHGDLLRFTTDVTTLLSFGHDMNTLEGDHALHVHMRRLLPAIMRRSKAPFAYWRYLPLPAEWRADRAARVVTDAMLAIIKEREPRAREGDTLLDRMLEARAQTGEGAGGGARFRDEEVVGNVLTMLLAGEDTTANAMAWLLYYAATSPGLWERMRGEVEAELPDGAPLDLARVARLRYSSAAFKEVLRLRSPTPILLLESVEDTDVGELAIPKGTLVTLLTRRVGMKVPGLSEPDAFRPERWLPGGELEGTAPETLLAFGSGPRLCPGRTLSEVETQVLMSRLCRRFDLRLSGEPEQVRERFAYTMEPAGLRLGLVPR